MSERALSLTPSAALREIQARTLEEIADGWDSQRNFTAAEIEATIRREAAAKRKGE